VGDTGWITGPGYKLKVTNTQRLPNDLFVHQGKVEEGVVRVNDPAHLEVDAERRRQIARHHTATHILQAILQQHLGSHVKQSGSLVAPERLRFDFTHFQAISPEELAQMEHDLNARVAENQPVETKVMPLAQALESGTMALFEEKYGDQVRVVAIPGFSRELCGGTHVRRTGDIGFCRITSEASVAAGIRRLEAVCGPAAIDLMQEMGRELDQAAGMLKGGRGDLLSRLEKVLKRQKELEKEVETLKSRLAAAQAKDLMEEVRDIGGVKVLALEVQAPDPKSLREYAVKFLDRLKSGIVVLGSAAGEKAMLIALVSKDLTKRFPAGEIIKELAPTVGGSGGGKPDLAQAGGPEKGKIGAAVQQAYEVVAKKG
jgi:alanyl-tRNA synthetase